VGRLRTAVIRLASPRAVALVLIAAVAAGCGGGGSDGGASSTATTTRAEGIPPPGSTAGLPPDIRRQLNSRPRPGSVREARGVTNLVLTGSSELACGPPLVTQHYLTASYGGREGCVEARRSGGVAHGVEFESARVEGDRATAVVIPSGGPSDRERVTVSLVAVPRNGRAHWAVDALRSNVPVGP
jgi:hypothetical protein